MVIIIIRNKQEHYRGQCLPPSPPALIAEHSWPRAMSEEHPPTASPGHPSPSPSTYASYALNPALLCAQKKTKKTKKRDREECDEWDDDDDDVVEGID